jgi:uroporphyrinogen decarboxylase
MRIETPFKEGYDFEHLRKVLLRETEEGPVPIFELAVDPEIMSEATGIDFPVKSYFELLNIGPESPPETLQLGIRLMDLIIDFYQAVGYDYVVMIPLVLIPRTRMQLRENPQQEGKMRGWQNEHKGLIMTGEDLEEFPWPSPDTVNIFPIEYAADRIPEGMKVVVFIFGIFEDLKLLMSFENMAIKSIDEPELLGDILERLTVLQEAAIDMAAAHPATGAILYAEDMGFNTATMLSPAWMREWVIPRHKRLAAACHKHDKPFILHSCGQIDALMEDEIETVGIDARHSFQDNIEPVEEVYEKYRDRISILGGIDVDLLARGTQEEVAKRTRQVLETCAPGGGFCMGSGNSVTNFCKIENYYAMLDETRKWNREHG